MGKATIKVQRFKARGGFSKCIGKHLSIRGKGAGSPINKIWYFLDCSEAEAVHRASWLKAEWRRLQALGHEVWPSGFTLPWGAADAADLSEPTPWLGKPSGGILAAAGQSQPIRTFRASQALLGDAFALFKKDADARLKAGEISVGRNQNLRNYISKTVEHLGESTPLASIGKSELIALVRHWRSRPLKEDGKPISPDYAKSLVSIGHTFFAWVGKQQGLWSAPSDLGDIFAWQKELAPNSEQERKQKYLAKKGQGVDVFDIPTLKTLYKAADAQMRAWMLLSLNAAFTQSEVAELRVYEVNQGKEWSISKVRPKTEGKAEVEGSWVLWSETVAAMKAAKADDNEYERWFLSPTGQPLTRYTAKSRSDYIARKFDELKDACGLKDAPSYKALRKNSATAMLKLSGMRAYQDAQTAHAEGYKMAQQYADKQWDSLHEYQRQMREYFKAVWS